MSRVKRLAVGTATAMVVAFAGTATVAHADQGDTLRGGCAFDSDQNDTTLTNGQNRGVIFDLSVSQGASGGPSGATVACWTDVNGSEYPGSRVVASGNGVQANAARIAFVAGDTDVVVMCQQVTFDDGSVWDSPDGTNPDCPVSVSPGGFPPQVLIDTIDTVLGALPGGVQQLVIDTVNDVLDQLPGAKTADGTVAGAVD